MTKHTRIEPPKTLDDIVLADKHIRADLQDYVDGYETGTLIFFGLPGTGKSTLARVIANMTCGVDVAEYINGSDKEAVKKIDCLSLMQRIDSQGWLKSKDAFGKDICTIVPTLIIDEVDRLPDGKMDELKALLDALERNKENEAWQWNVFLTTNHLDKISPAMRSRSKEMLIRGLTAQDAVPAVQRILQREGIIQSDAAVLKQIQLGITATRNDNTRIDWRRVIDDCQRVVRKAKRQQAAQTTQQTQQHLTVVK
jgi:replication-associated recombination protein RarA